MGVDAKGWPTGPSNPKWPRLSETLTGPRAPDRCQACGAAGLPVAPTDAGADVVRSALSVWQEMGDFDQPTRPPVHVVLCQACAARLIEPHPRLYARQAAFKPMLGVMALCAGCKHRDGLSCTSPLYTASDLSPGIALPEGKPVPEGWAGLVIRAPEPSQVHFYRRGKGARSGWETIYNGSPTSCNGRETTDGITDACDEHAGTGVVSGDEPAGPGDRRGE